MIGAHYDHLGYDPTLEGDQVYNGADDNASGVAAVLQVARAFLATEATGTLLFCFLGRWRKKGLLGSRYFTMTYPELKKIKGYLNYDMIGRNNEEQPKGVVYFYTAAHPAFGDWLKKTLKTTACNWNPIIVHGTIL